jgi:hypothetical protein
LCIASHVDERWAACLLPHENMGFLSSKKTKQHTYTINHRKTMPMRNRTRIVTVSPEMNDVYVGAAQKQQAPTGHCAAARKHGGSRVASHGGDATRHLLQRTMGSWRSCYSWASMAGEDAGLQGKKLTKGRCCEGEGRSVHGR